MQRKRRDIRLEPGDRRLRKNELCTSPLTIGKTYRDGWGRKHEILGYACVNFFSEDRYADVVYSTSDHFHQGTGRGLGCTLVNLPREEELAHFRSRLEDILRSNPPDKLALVEEELMSIREHITNLEREDWQRA